MVKMLSGLAAIVFSLFSSNVFSRYHNYHWSDNPKGVYSDGNGSFVVVSEVDGNNIDYDKLSDASLKIFRDYIYGSVGSGKICWSFDKEKAAVVEYGIDGEYEVKVVGCIRVNDLRSMPDCDKEIGFILGKKLKEENEKLNVINCY